MGTHKARKCIGYDANGKGFDCPNFAGTGRLKNPYWCGECDKRRLNRISGQFEEIQKSFQPLPTGEHDGDG